MCLVMGIMMMACYGIRFEYIRKVLPWLVGRLSSPIIGIKIVKTGSREHEQHSFPSVCFALTFGSGSFDTRVSPFL